uniref:BTB domain-containing protein n=1 Tax=Leptobrachium leishanense TaxID=445787 RepID=A0A8C5N2D5_9ANUR
MAPYRGWCWGRGTRHVIINVGGIKYRIPWTTLENCPLMQLGKLKACNNYDEIMDFFFDRNPCAFRTIITFLAAGKLRTLHEIALQDSGRLAQCMKHLRDMVENPHSGVHGKIFACLSVSFVAITAVSLCISTMTDFREEEDWGECSQKCHDIFVLETVCVAWFSLEFILRFIQAERMCLFLSTPLNIIDMMAILPYYITIIVDAMSGENKSGGAGNNYLEKVGLVLRVLRALRILYVMRLARHSLGLQTLGLTVRRCTKEFGLLLLFLCVAMALFSPLEFTSIPGSYWWSVISMTTVWYGDMVPRSIPGQVVALSSILSGILLMAFPVTSIFHIFSRSYS